MKSSVKSLAELGQELNHIDSSTSIRGGIISPVSRRHPVPCVPSFSTLVSCIRLASANALGIRDSLAPTPGVGGRGQKSASLPFLTSMHCGNHVVISWPSNLTDWPSFILVASTSLTYIDAYLIIPPWIWQPTHITHESEKVYHFVRNSLKF